MTYRGIFSTLVALHTTLEDFLDVADGGDKSWV